MILEKAEWAQICAQLCIENRTGGAKPSVTFRRNVFEAQILSSSSLEHVHHMGAFSIIRSGASIHNLHLGRFCAIGANFVCAPPEHRMDWIGSSSVFLKQYDWASSEQHYPIPRPRAGFTIRPVTMGSDIWVGRDVYVKGGVTIGHGAVIAAKSVVTRDVPPYAIVGGNPARIIRYRFDEGTIRDLLHLAWWDLDPVWMTQVDPADVPGVIAHLKANRGNIPPLRPATVRFGPNGYKITPRG